MVPTVVTQRDHQSKHTSTNNATGNESVEKKDHQDRPVNEPEFKFDKAQSAVDPESLLLSVQKDLAKARHEPTALILTDTALTLIDLFYLPQNKADQEAQQKRREDDRKRRNEKEQEISTLENRIQDLKSSLLRRHTLSSSVSIERIIICPHSVSIHNGVG